VGKMFGVPISSMPKVRSWVLLPGSVHCHATQVVEHVYWNVDVFIAQLDANDSPETCGSTLHSHFGRLRSCGGG
jgi:hypothetical protein